MKITRRLIQILLTLILSFTMLPQRVMADEEREETFTWYNPLYYDGEQAEPLNSGDAAAAVDASAVQTVRNHLKARHTNFVVGYPDGALPDTKELMNQAMAHTGQPTEGDYLKWQFGQWNSSVRYSPAGDGYGRNIQITYTVQYYTNASQEAQVDAAVSELLEELALDGYSDYAKVKAVYDWMADNISYAMDYQTNPQDINHTAYGAIIRRVCVCQGYAVLFYRLMCTLGIDCRLISGIGNGGGHAWNIVKLGDLYYDLDVTWASTAHNKPAFFLRGTDYFDDHDPDDEYDSAEFYAVYPLSPDDYLPTEDDYKISVTDLILEPESLELDVDETAVLTAEVMPEKATDKTVTWVSDDPSVASVSANGTVTAIAPGETVIRASAGNISKECTVTVRAPEEKEIAYAAIDTQKKQGIFFRSHTSLLSKEQEIDVEDILGNVYHVKLLTSDADGDRLEDGLANDASLYAMFAGSGLPCESIAAAPEQTIRLCQSMAGWFMDLSSLREFDGTGLDTAAVVDMRSLFAGDSVLTNADLTGFDTASVLYFQEMFKDCGSLKELDLSSFDTSSAKNMKDMFAGCTALESVTLGKGFTVWNADARLPEGIWTNGSLYKTEKELQTEYPAHAAEWQGTWTRLPAFTVVWNWSENLTEATASTVLSDGTVLLTVTAEVTLKDVPAECEKDGSRTASAKAVLFDVEYTDTRSMVLKATGHDWQKPSYVWSKSYNTCTATAVCAHDGSHVLTETADAVRTVIREPGCETEGTVQYKASFKSQVFTEQTAEDTIAALGHDWSDWQTVKEPTEEAPGLEERTCSRCGEKEQREIPPLAHVHKLIHFDAEDALCEKDGHIEYWQCETCGRCYRDAEAENEISLEDTIIPALGHDWHKQSYVWSKSYNTCTATAVCSHDSSHVLTETVDSVRTVIKEAGCETEGIVQYKATFKSPVFAEQTVEDTISPLGHDWQKPTYVWSKSYGTCTATAVCSHDSSHVLTETVDSVLTVIKEAGCETEGTVQYKAAFKSTVFTEQTAEDTISPLGHDWSDWTVVKEPTETEPGLRQRTCRRCGETETEEIPPTGQGTVHVTGVELNKNELTLRVGKSEKLTATVLPADAEDKTVTWSSSDPTAVTVDENGRVTAVKDNGIEQPSEAVITVTTKDDGYTASCTVTVEDPINQFVRRLYRLCFDREAEESGFNTWTTVLKNRSYTAARAVVGFFLSDEMKALDLEPEEFVERCYLVMMDRESDEGGMKTWSDRLRAGMSELYILLGFIGSGEFQAICADTGIEVGTIKITEARDMNFGITAFVSRCYTEVLERTAEAEGLNTWCGYIFKDANRKANAIWVASNGFFHSPEYRAKHTSNAQYVHTLYRTFLGRDEDEAGYNMWTGLLAKGKSRDEVMMGFANSSEFAEIMKSYGIQ